MAALPSIHVPRAVGQHAAAGQSARRYLPPAAPGAAAPRAAGGGWPAQPFPPGPGPPSGDWVKVLYGNVRPQWQEPVMDSADVAEKACPNRFAPR